MLAEGAALFRQALGQRVHFIQQRLRGGGGLFARQRQQRRLAADVQHRQVQLVVDLQIDRLREADAVQLGAHVAAFLQPVIQHAALDAQMVDLNVMQLQRFCSSRVRVPPANGVAGAYCGLRLNMPPFFTRLMACRSLCCC